jgi:hypothetical protein
MSAVASFAFSSVAPANRFSMIIAANETLALVAKVLDENHTFRANAPDPSTTLFATVDEALHLGIFDHLGAMSR